MRLKNSDLLCVAGRFLRAPVGATLNLPRLTGGLGVRYCGGMQKSGFEIPIPLSDNEKAQALTQHAKARGFTLPEDVTLYLLNHVARDMGALFATLDALDRHSLETKRAVTVPLLRGLLSAAKNI